MKWLLEHLMVEVKQLRMSYSMEYKLEVILYLSEHEDDLKLGSLTHLYTCTYYGCLLVLDKLKKQSAESKMTSVGDLEESLIKSITL